MRNFNVKALHHAYECAARYIGTLWSFQFMIDLF